MFWSQPHPEKLNEWGDFFGGFLSPIAIVWLVVGYLQQREEIRNAAEALAEEQQDRRNAARPVFVLSQTGTSSGGPLGMVYNLSLLNAGNMAANVVFRLEPALPHNNPQSFPLIQRGHPVAIDLPWQNAFSTNARVTYTDSDGMPGEVSISLEGDNACKLEIGPAVRIT